MSAKLDPMPVMESRPTATSSLFLNMLYFSNDRSTLLSQRFGYWIHLADSGFVAVDYECHILQTRSHSLRALPVYDGEFHSNPRHVEEVELPAWFRCQLPYM